MKTTSTVMMRIVAAFLIAVFCGCEGLVWAASSALRNSKTPVPLKPKTVTASKGPFKLTFEVANTEVREYDGLWVRLTMTNVGKKSLKVSNGPFFDILQLSAAGTLFIEVRDAKTKQAQTRRLREDILWTEKLDECLARYEKDHPEPEEVKVRVLKPGVSVSTPAKPPVHDFALRHCEKDAPPLSMPPYGEIPDWEWEAPAYEVRAVYDNTLRPGWEKHLTPEGKSRMDEFIRFETPWVGLRRVVP